MDWRHNLPRAISIYYTHEGTHYGFDSYADQPALGSPMPITWRIPTGSIRILHELEGEEEIC